PIPLLRGAAKAALNCAHRTSTVSSCVFCEQGGHLAAPRPLFQHPARRLGFQNRLHFCYMTVDLDLPKDGLQFAGLVDHKGAAFDSPILSAVHIFLFVTAVGLRDRGLFVAQQREGQVELLDELLVRLFAVQAHTENDGSRLLHRSDGIAKVARFLGTTGGVIFGVKIEHHLLARKTLQADPLSRLVGKRQSGSLVTDGEFLCHINTPFLWLSMTIEARGWGRPSPGAYLAFGLISFWETRHCQKG